MKHKHIKWYYIIFWSLCVVLFTGCRNNTKMPTSYQFIHSMDNIVGIELLFNNSKDAFSADSKFVLLRELDESQIAEFMSAVYELETDCCISPPPRGYGQYIARITYSNGDVEMLGTNNIEFIEFGAKPTGIGMYYFPGDALEELIILYANQAE